jgi:lysophospholipase L1-like esterase
MIPFRFVRRATLGLLLLLAPASPGMAAEFRLTPVQEAHLKGLLPRTLAKLQQRERIRVVSVGDSISTFYQPPGFPRYDSSMAWQGRLLSRLGGYYFYHGTEDVDPHREITASQKEATSAWARFASEMEIWQRTKQGEAPLPPDALRFRADLESPVAMGASDLVRRNSAGAQQSLPGTAIQIHNLARDGAQAAQALEALGPEAFPPAPAPPTDLVTICYGVNDAANNLTLDSYRAFLTAAVKLCQKKGPEILLAAPPVSFDAGAPRLSLGRTRPYAQIAKEVALATGVAFVDLGAALVEAPSDLASLTASDAFAAAIIPVTRHFSYRSDTPDTLHPNAAATLMAGERAAGQLLDGPSGGPVEVSGSVEITGPTEAILQLRIFNPTTAARSVVVSPLSFLGWQLKTGTPDAAFNLTPGKARRLNLALEPTTSGPAPDGHVIRGSLILSDDDRQQIVDVVLPLRPLSLTWPEGRLDAASGEVLLTATLTNHSQEPVKGTALVQWMGKDQPLPFSLEPKQSMPLPLRLALPDPAGTLRFDSTVALQITLPDRALRFERHVEGVRHLGLEQRIPLKPADPSPAASPDAAAETALTAFADARGLYFFIDAPSTSGSAGKPGSSWGIVDVQIDGRKAGENGTLGFVDRLSATIPWTDGPIALRKIRPAAFGHPYHYDYHPDGFRVSATTRPDGSRRIEFNIARVNLVQHEWSLDGSGQNSLGFNVRVTRHDPVTGRYIPAQTQILTGSAFGVTDARSLTLLELSRTPSTRWSLRIF